MKRWETFEEECYDYLQEMLESYKVQVKKQGGTNAYSEDLYVHSVPRDELIGSVETKLCPAQSGQFSLEWEEGTFSFSKANGFPPNQWSDAIIRYLNQDPDRFDTVTQNGIPLRCEEGWFYEWVKEHYRQKATPFIITSDDLGSFKRVVPIEEIERWFSVSGVVRRKKSGSRYVPQKEREHAFWELLLHSEQLGIDIEELEVDGEKVWVSFEDEPLLTYAQCSFGDHYYLSKDPEKERYAMKRKGYTNSPTVVFSLTYIGEKEDGGVYHLKRFFASYRGEKEQPSKS